MGLRQSQTLEVLVDISESTTISGYKNIEGFSYGSLQLPAAFDSGNMTIGVTNDEDSTGAPTNWAALKNNANTAITVFSVAALDRFPLASEVFHFKYVRFTFAAQSADRTVLLQVIE